MTKQVLVFVLAVGIQLAILAAVPAKKIHTRLTGTLITIKTMPIDPYDFLSGYHVVLGYEISRLPEEHRQFTQQEDQTVYVILRMGPEDIWAIESVSRTLPQQLPPDRVVLKGKTRYERIEYGIESFFIPEEGRHEIESALRNNRQNALAQVKVDRFGNAALIRLIIDGKEYEY
jgi:uncharacterized membrane-anchored protein